MNMVGLKCLGSWVGVFVLMSSQLFGEFVTTKAKPDGRVVFQIHGADPAAKYLLKLAALDRADKDLQLDSFIESEMDGILVSDWNPPIKDSLYRIQLMKNGKVVFNSQDLGVLAAQEMETGIGKINRKDGVVDWSLEKPSIVRLLAVTGNGMLVDTIEKWHFASNERHQSGWSFFDPQNVRDYRQDSGLEALVQRQSLPGGWVVVGSPEVKNYPSLTSSLVGLPNTQFGISVSPIDAPDGAGSRLRGIRMDLEHQTAKYLSDKRYEILIYVNGEFFHEESQGVNPYTFVFPDSLSWSGDQVITVNVLDYEGNFGSYSLKGKL